MSEPEKTLDGLKAGRESQFEKIVDRYFQRVVRAAEKRISKQRKRAVDGDDIAASVFESLWKDSNEGGLTELADENELWSYIARLMNNKVTDHMRKENAEKRGGGQVRGGSVFVSSRDEGKEIEVPESSTFTPQELVEFREQQQTLLEILPDERLREIVVLRMEGHDVVSIAEKIGLSDRSIKRKLAIIRDTWQVHFHDRELAQVVRR